MGGGFHVAFFFFFLFAYLLLVVAKFRLNILERDNFWFQSTESFIAQGRSAVRRKKYLHVLQPKCYVLWDRRRRGTALPFCSFLLRRCFSGERFIACRLVGMN